MRFVHLLWVLCCVFALSACSKPVVEVELAKQNPEGKTRYCPFCQQEVALPGKGKDGEVSYGHFHKLLAPVNSSKSREVIDKALGWVKKARLSETYSKAAEKGAIGLDAMLQAPEKDQALIGLPLTRIYTAKVEKGVLEMEVRADFANVDGKNSVYCPICNVQVSPKGHIDGQTAYDATTKTERPYDFVRNCFWPQTEESESGSSGEGAHWCTQCKCKASNSGHLHGVTHFCELCNVEAYNVGHIHMQTQYCSHPKCRFNDEGVQSIYGLEKGGHVHGWTQYCPVCQAEMPYEEITVVQNGQEEVKRGFINDMIQVVSNKETEKVTYTPDEGGKSEEMYPLALMQQLLQGYKIKFNDWPESLGDVEKAPKLSDGKVFEYYKKDGKSMVRIIRNDPEPQVMVVRGRKATLYKRGYYNTQGKESSESDMVKKDPDDFFRIKRKVYDMVLVVRYEKNNFDKRISTVKSAVGTISSMDTSSVSIKSPEEMEQSFSGDLVLARAEEWRNLNTEEIWNKLNASRVYTVIKIYTHSIELKNDSGEKVKYTTCHDHAFPLKTIPVASTDDVKFEERDQRVPKWNYLMEEVKKASELEGSSSEKSSEKSSSDRN